MVNSVMVLAGGSCGRGQSGPTTPMRDASARRPNVAIARNAHLPCGLRRQEAICGIVTPPRYTKYRRRRGALHLASCRRNQAHHTFTAACKRVSGQKNARVIFATASQQFPDSLRRAGLLRASRHLSAQPVSRDPCSPSAIIKLSRLAGNITRTHPT